MRAMEETEKRERERERGGARVVVVAHLALGVRW